MVDYFAAKSTVQINYIKCLLHFKIDNKNESRIYSFKLIKIKILIQ